MSTEQDVYLDAGMRGWIANTARKNFWRVAHWYELDDLIQDGYICFAKCRARYVGKRNMVNSRGERCRYLPERNPDKTARQHFAALVKITYHNHITDLAKSRMRLEDHAVSQLCTPEQSAEEYLDTQLPPEPEAATLAVLLAGAPAEVAELLRVLAADGLDLLRFQRRRVGRRLLRETSNEFYCRLLGKDPNTVDVLAQVRAYFGSM